MATRKGLRERCRLSGVTRLTSRQRGSKAPFGRGETMKRKLDVRWPGRAAAPPSRRPRDGWAHPPPKTAMDARIDPPRTRDPGPWGRRMNDGWAHRPPDTTMDVHIHPRDPGPGAGGRTASLGENAWLAGTGGALAGLIGVVDHDLGGCARRVRAVKTAGSSGVAGHEAVERGTGCFRA